MPEFAVDAILFDCDGVLVDSLEPAALAWDGWARTYAPQFDFRTQIEHGVRAADTIATLVAADILDEAVAALEAAELATASETRPIPGAVDLTRSLDALPWAVVTSGTRALATARLASAGHPSPSALVAAEDVGQGKPHPEPYLAGASALGVPVGRCVVVEDAPAGVQAARAAGAGFVIGVGEKVAGSAVDALVPDLSALSFRDGIVRVA
jgi:sugar-phosphatase